MDDDEGALGDDGGGGSYEYVATTDAHGEPAMAEEVQASHHHHNEMDVDDDKDDRAALAQAFLLTSDYQRLRAAGPLPTADAAAKLERQVTATRAQLDALKQAHDVADVVDPSLPSPSLLRKASAAERVALAQQQLTQMQQELHVVVNHVEQRLLGPAADEPVTPSAAKSSPTTSQRSSPSMSPTPMPRALVTKKQPAPRPARDGSAKRADAMETEVLLLLSKLNALKSHLPATDRVLYPSPPFVDTSDLTSAERIDIAEKQLVQIRDYIGRINDVLNERSTIDPVPQEPMELPSQTPLLETSFAGQASSSSSSSSLASKHEPGPSHQPDIIVQSQTTAPCDSPTIDTSALPPTQPTSSSSDTPDTELLPEPPSASFARQPPVFVLPPPPPPILPPGFVPGPVLVPTTTARDTLREPLVWEPNGDEHATDNHSTRSNSVEHVHTHTESADYEPYVPSDAEDNDNSPAPDEDVMSIRSDDHYPGSFLPTNTLTLEPLPLAESDASYLAPTEAPNGPPPAAITNQTAALTAQLEALQEQILQFSELMTTNVDPAQPAEANHVASGEPASSQPHLVPFLVVEPRRMSGPVIVGPPPQLAPNMGIQLAGNGARRPSSYLPFEPQAREPSMDTNASLDTGGRDEQALIDPEELPPPYSPHDTFLMQPMSTPENNILAVQRDQQNQWAQAQASRQFEEGRSRRDEQGRRYEELKSLSVTTFRKRSRIAFFSSLLYFIIAWLPLLFLALLVILLRTVCALLHPVNMYESFVGFKALLSLVMANPSTPLRAVLRQDASIMNDQQGLWNTEWGRINTMLFRIWLPLYPLYLLIFGAVTLATLAVTFVLLLIIPSVPLLFVGIWPRHAVTLFVDRFRDWCYLILFIFFPKHFPVTAPEELERRDDMRLGQYTMRSFFGSVPYDEPRRVHATDSRLVLVGHIMGVIDTCLRVAVLTVDIIIGIFTSYVFYLFAVGIRNNPSNSSGYEQAFISFVGIAVTTGIAGLLCLIDVVCIGYRLLFRGSLNALPHETISSYIRQQSAFFSPLVRRFEVQERIDWGITRNVVTIAACFTPSVIFAVLVSWNTSTFGAAAFNTLLGLTVQSWAFARACTSLVCFVFLAVDIVCYAVKPPPAFVASLSKPIHTSSIRIIYSTAAVVVFSGICAIIICLVVYQDYR